MFFNEIKQISPLEDVFLKRLGAIALMPDILYYYGNLQNLELQGQPRKSVAIVGSRKNTPYGERIAYGVAYELARLGVVIVSGLAYGIDAVAHRGAVAAKGRTVAVLGTEIEKIYPRNHVNLAKEILENAGVILSEYRNGMPVFPKTSFLARNRIIAGLADVVLVVEAGERSGSLNTACYALNQGKPLYAVPGDINRRNSLGCNRLLRQGATPLITVDHVVEELFPELLIKKIDIAETNCDLEERQILNVMRQGVTGGENIMTQTGLTVDQFGISMTMLELKGYVRSLGANEWMLLERSAKEY